LLPSHSNADDLSPDRHRPGFPPVDAMSGCLVRRHHLYRWSRPTHLQYGHRRASLHLSPLPLAHPPDSHLVCRRDVPRGQGAQGQKRQHVEAIDGPEEQVGLRVDVCDDVHLRTVCDPHDVGSQLGDPPNGVHIIRDRELKFGIDGECLPRISSLLHVLVLERNGDRPRSG
ncbi:hypothetical protein PMAYCL1PPCAC_18930, partial [Pristionchus mayeri]